MKVQSRFFERGGSLSYFLHLLSLQTGLVDLNDHRADLLSVWCITMYFNFLQMNNLTGLLRQFHFQNDRVIGGEVMWKLNTCIQTCMHNHNCFKFVRIDMYALYVLCVFYIYI